VKKDVLSFFGVLYTFDMFLSNDQSRLQVFDSELDAIVNFTQILNEGSNDAAPIEGAPAILRRFVQDWFKSGKNLGRVIALCPILEQIELKAFVKGGGGDFDSRHRF
jgi:hypothetical protein